MGRKAFLKPMLESSFDENAKNTMHTGYHYISVFLLLNSVALCWLGLNDQILENAELLIKFITLNFFGFALLQLGHALSSKFHRGIFKPRNGSFSSLLLCLAGRVAHKLKKDSQILACVYIPKVLIV